MAKLTNEQKKNLDMAVAEYLMQNTNKQLYLDEIIEALDEEIRGFHKKSYEASLDRLDYYGVSRYMLDNGIQMERTYNSVKLVFKKYTCIDHISKERNILHLMTKDNNIVLNYDFITKSFYTPNGIVIEQVTDNDFDCQSLNTYHCIENALEYEWLFNYTDNAFTICNILRYVDKDFLNNTPNCLVEALNKGSRFDYQLINELAIKQRYGNFGYNFIEEFDIEAFKAVENTIGMKNLIKMAQVSLKSGEFSIKHDIHDFIESLESIRNIDNYMAYIDTNRSLSHNTEIMDKAIKEKDNEILVSQMRKLNFINGMKVNGCVVVVPQTVAEKKEEGKMQNNCVGHYYDNDIKRGSDYIYFIRKESTPNKSYITCRYNVSIADSIECRYKNNVRVNDATDKETIKIISKIIRDNLK